MGAAVSGDWDSDLQPWDSDTSTWDAEEPLAGAGGGGGIYWKPPSGGKYPEKEIKKAVKELLAREKAKEEAKRKRPAALAKEMVKAIEMIAPAGLGKLEKKAMVAHIRAELPGILQGRFVPVIFHDRRAVEKALLHLQLQAIEALRQAAEEDDEEAVMLLLAAA
jgi:hypothetical protein